MSFDPIEFDVNLTAQNPEIASKPTSAQEKTQTTTFSFTDLWNVWIGRTTDSSLKNRTVKPVVPEESPTASTQPEVVPVVAEEVPADAPKAAEAPITVPVEAKNEPGVPATKSSRSFFWPITSLVKLICRAVAFIFSPFFGR